MNYLKTKTAWIWLVWFLGLGLCSSAYFWVPDILTAALEGQSFQHLNRLVARHHLKAPEIRTAEFYQLMARQFASRMLLIYLLLGSLTASLLTFWWNLVKAFFLQPSSSINLGVFRIVVFATALISPQVQWHLFSAPASALDAPLFWRQLINAGFWFPTLNQGLVIAFSLFCALAIIGYKTRWTTTLACGIGLWVLGVPQFFGKINHYHHVWLFMLYCSLSPSGDSLSLDARLAKQTAQTGSQYRWPLAWAAFTLGLLYFFPGLWKVVVSGSDWVFSDNLQNKMYTKWFESGFQPIFRIDHYPWLLQLGALHTLAFETFFVFALFHPITRWMAIASAFAFHHFTLLFMGIYFDSLVVMYVMFVDWPRLLRSQSLPSIETQWQPRGWNWLPAGVCGVLVFCGATLLDTWPVGVYPTFASLEKPYIKTLFVEKVARDTLKVENTYLPLKSPSALKKFSYSGNLQSYILNFSMETNSEKKRSMARYLLSSLEAELTPQFLYRFYLTPYPTNPDLIDPAPDLSTAKVILELSSD